MGCRRSCWIPTTTWPGSGCPWPNTPSGWQPADTALAADYFDNTEVVVWTPRRAGGRPLSFQPLPDFSSVVDDADEYNEAVESAFAALEPRALIAGKTAKAQPLAGGAARGAAMVRPAAVDESDGFIGVLVDLPDGISAIAGADDLAAELGQNLRAAKVNDPMFGGDGTPGRPGRPAHAVGRLPRPGVGDQPGRTVRRTISAQASSTSCRWRCSRGSNATRPATDRSAGCW